MRFALAVAECGSFSRASALLGVAVSAVSRTIRDLEDSLGVGLFDRLPRGVRLTTAGTAYIAEAREILARSERAVYRARRAGEGELGELSLGHVWSLARDAGASLLKRYREANPGVTLHLTEDGADALLSLLARGDLDVVLTATTASAGVIRHGPTDLRQITLWTERLYAIVPASERRALLTWADVAEHHVLHRRADAARGHAQPIQDAGGETLRLMPQDCSHEGLLALVAAGVGWALVPESLARSDLDSIRFVPIVSDGASLQVVALWRSQVDNPALTRFIALARQIYAEGRD